MKALLLVFALAFICTQAAPGTYSNIDPKELETSSTLKELLKFAQEEFTKEATEARKISDSELTFKKVISASQQVVNGLNVKFNVELTDKKGKNYYVNWLVFYQPWTGVKQLTLYY